MTGEKVYIVYRMEGGTVIFLVAFESEDHAEIWIERYGNPEIGYYIKEIELENPLQMFSDLQELRKHMLADAERPGALSMYQTFGIAIFGRNFHIFDNCNMVLYRGDKKELKQALQLLSEYQDMKYKEQ